MIIPENEIIHCNELTVHISNVLMGLWTIDESNGEGTPTLLEDQYLTVKNGQIEIDLHTEILVDCRISTYYGNQRVGQGYDQDSLYYAHGSSNENYGFIQPFDNNTDSGVITDYPDAEKVIISNSNKSINHILWMDMSQGLPAEVFIPDDHYRWFIPNWKLYFNQIFGSREWFAGDTFFWHGGFGYLKNIQDLDKASYAYIHYEAGDTYLIIDFCKNGEWDDHQPYEVSETFLLTDHEFYDIEIISGDGSVSITDFSIIDQSITVNSTGYGNIKIKLIDEAILLPPANLEISVQSDEVTLQWSPVVGAASYNVYSSDNPYSDFFIDNSGILDGTSWNTSITAGRRFYIVKAE